MKKRVILSALYAIPLLLFNLLFFLIAGTSHPASVWISYAWIQVAFLILPAAPLLPRKTENSPVYRISLALIAFIYCAVEFVIGMIVIALRPASVRIPIAVQAVPFCLFLLVFLCDWLFIEFASDADKKREEKEKAEKAEKPKTE